MKGENKKSAFFYDFIEVYVDCCRAISSTGAVSVISC